MARVMCILILFTVIGACAFAVVAKPRTVPIPAAGKHAVRRSGSDNWPKITEVLSFPGKDYTQKLSVQAVVCMQNMLMVYTLLEARTVIALSTRMVTGQFTTGSWAMRQIIGCWTSMT